MKSVVEPVLMLPIFNTTIKHLKRLTSRNREWLDTMTALVPQLKDITATGKPGHLDSRFSERHIDYDPFSRLGSSVKSLANHSISPKQHYHKNL